MFKKYLATALLLISSTASAHYRFHCTNNYITVVYSMGCAYANNPFLEMHSEDYQVVFENIETWSLNESSEIYISANSNDGNWISFSGPQDQTNFETEIIINDDHPAEFSCERRTMRC